ncbi:hypothetical protein QJS66_15515 [Kocuria rhizophila]|nr:hypothetical protein QJS66_15515 [Kocuria rhizophila]
MNDQNPTPGQDRGDAAASAAVSRRSPSLSAPLEDASSARMAQMPPASAIGAMQNPHGPATPHGGREAHAEAHGHGGHAVPLLHDVSDAVLMVGTTVDVTPVTCRWP